VMRRSANLMLAGILVAVAVAAGAVATTLPTRSGGGAAAGAEEPYTSRWLCPILPGVKGELAVANTGTNDALLRGTVRWDRSDRGVIEPQKESAPPEAPSNPDGADEATTTTAPGSDQTTTTRPADGGGTEAGGQAPSPAEQAQASRSVGMGQPLKPGEVRKLAYGQGERFPGIFEVESFGAPVAVNGSGQPVCVPGAATKWWLPVTEVPEGGDTRVVIANPGDDGATVQVVLHTASLGYRPSQLKSLFIPARSARFFSVKALLPSVLEQSVQVQALFGRVVVGGLTTDGAGDKAPTIVPPQTGGRASWAFAGGLSGSAGQTSLVLTNPGADPLQVDVDVLSEKETIPLPADEDLEVGPESMVSIPVEVDVDGPIGVRVRSRSGVNFDAGLRVSPTDGSTYIDAGGSGDDDHWILPQVTGPPLALANYGKEPLRFTFFDLAGKDLGKTGELAPDRIVNVREVPKVEGGLVVRTDGPGLVVRTASDLQAIPAEWIGGLPVRGQVRPGPAAG
jgi:hypothetical protein